MSYLGKFANCLSVVLKNTVHINNDIRIDLKLGAVFNLT